MSTEQKQTENPVTVVHEVLLDWLEENEATDFDENDVAHLFGMLGTAGYSIVPNATMSLADAGLAELSKVVAAVCAPHAGYNADYRQQAAAIEQLELLWGNTLAGLLLRLQTAEAPKWVAVGERLPDAQVSGLDYSVRVLAMGEKQVDGPQFVAYCSRRTGLWFLAHDNQPVMKVTHWQPLPAAPAAE